MFAKRTVFVLLFATLILTACAQSTPAPTPDLNALRTSVAQTVVADITAFAPTMTATPASPTPTNTPKPTNTPLVTPTATPPCYEAEYVADITIPDYYDQLQPRQLFVKTWQIKNTGSCPWTPDFRLVFGYGEKMNGQTQPIGVDVQPGETIEVSVTLLAPQKPDTYTAAWRMSNTLGDPFGDFLTVIIVMP